MADRNIVSDFVTPAVQGTLITLSVTSNTSTPYRKYGR